MFDRIRAALRAEEKKTLDWALAGVKKAIETVVDEYDKLKARATEKAGLLEGEVELKAEEFLDAETVAIMRDLEALHERLVAKMKKTPATGA